jgi:hypothetical protein
MNPFTIKEYQQFHLNSDRLEKCYEEKWFKLFVPKTYNGLQLSMEDGCKELLKIAEIQGGLGWTVNLGAGANWFSGFFDDEIAKELFTPENAVIAGSGTTNGDWKPTELGFKITGEWSKCTGAIHATLFSLAANNDEHNSKIFVVPKDKVQLSEEKWPIMGMRNSSSFGITLNEVEIPKGYDFQMNVIKNNADYGVFHIPFQSFARLCMSASYLGVIKCLVKNCLKDLRKPLVISTIENDLLPLIHSSAEKLYAFASQIEKACLAGEYQAEDEQNMRTELGGNNMKIFKVVQTLFLAGGLPFIEEDKLVHWAYRDVLTAVQHFMVKP